MRSRSLRQVSLFSLLAFGAGCEGLLGLGDFVAADATSTGSGGAASSSSSTEATSTSTGDVGGEGPGTGGAPSQGGSGPGGAGGAGGSEPCEEGATCYDGPEGTDGVGMCRGGTVTCDEDGVATCEGQVLPAAEEDCGAVGDEDCNGEADVADGGAACVCAPGSFVDCYTGEAGTEDEGICVGGQAECDADGLGIGDCVGEVTPTDETCALPGDEDCDGETNEEGDGCSCTPATTQVCYSGPPATRGVGLCQDGSQVCAGDGTGYGPCNGERTPLAENCDATGDEDCDGIPCSEAQWAAQYGGSGDQVVTGIATAPNGDVIVVGYFAGSLPFGSPSLISAGGEDVFVARFTSAGAHVWSRQFGSTVNQRALGVAVSPGGDVAVVGQFRGTMVVGSTTLAATSADDAFLFKLNPSGTPLWARAYGGNGDQVLTRVAAASEDSLYVGGEAAGSIDFGNGQLAGDIIRASPVVAKIPASGGSAVWSKIFVDLDEAEFGGVGGIAVDAQDNVVFSGRYGGTVSFGGGQLASDGATDRTDFFLARYNSAGAHSWSLRTSGGAYFDDVVTAAAVDAVGNVYVAGSTGDAAAGSAINFGGGSVTTRKTDGFVAKYASTGAYLGSRLFGGAEVDLVSGLSVLPDGRVAIVGQAGAVGDWGGISTGAAGAAVVAVLDSSLVAVWAHAFARGGNGVVASDAASSLLLGLNASGNVDLGTGALLAGGGGDVVVGKLFP